MIKKLTRHGNSMALVIERPVLELLDIDADTPLEITTDGRVLVVSPVQDLRRRRKLRAALARANAKYSRMLKRLAD
jgi:antitoxin MazE